MFNYNNFSSLEFFNCVHNWSKNCNTVWCSFKYSERKYSWQLITNGERTVREIRFLHFTWSCQILYSVDYDKLCIREIQRDALKNIVGKSKWNSKKFSSNLQKNRKNKTNEKERRQVKQNIKWHTLSY